MHRIELTNTHFEGENNVYLFDGDGPTTLVDAGVAVPDTREQLEDGLADRDCSVADVDQVLLTHFHEDHAGLAGEIQAESGATVRIHAADAPLVTGDGAAREELRQRRETYFEDWGMPPEGRAELRAIYAESEPLGGQPCDVETFEPDERLRAGDEELTVMHLPGHTDGLCGFVRETDDGRELLSGDALLPEYTPNVGGADVRVDRPLERYLTTLDRIVDGEFVRTWPGHRYPIEDTTGRALEILHHHYERTQRVVETLAEHGPADAWTVSAHLFGDLDGIHILHGPGEAFAHLDHLASHGVVERTDEGYTLLSDHPPVESLFPERAVSPP